MNKYIDADFYVEMQIYDDEHEEWGEWCGTIEDLLNHWTEQGCPPTIEVQEDCISRKYISDSLIHRIATLNAQGEKALPISMELIKFKKFIDDITPAIPTGKTGEWIISEDGDSTCSVCGASEEEFIYGLEKWYGMGDSNYCPACGAKMRLK